MKQTTTSLIVLAAMLVSAGIASGAMLTPVSELHNLVESGTDRLGRSTDMDGGFTIVGADLDADNGGSAGAAYVYDTVTGAELYKLKASDGNTFDYFGSSVAVSGNYAVVGSTGKEAVGSGSTTAFGAAYVFDLTTGNQVAKLVANVENQGSSMGMTVGMDGNNVVVAAHMYDTSGENAAGAVFHYDLGSLIAHGTEAGTFVENRMIVSPVVGNGFQFGSDVSIDGTTLIVGESGLGLFGTPSWQRGGEAHLFDVSDGSLLGSIVPDDTPQTTFGFGVAIDGDTLAIGARGLNTAAVKTGVAYLFDITDPAARVQNFRLEEVGGSVNDNFGMNVDLEDGVLLVACQGDDEGSPNSGSALLYDVATGTMLQKILASDASGNAMFGNDVAMSGNYLVVGATGPDHAYIFGPAATPGDFDGDGDVDADDVDILCANMGGDPATYDMDEDGDVDEDDMTFLIEALVELTDGVRVGTKRGDFNLDGLVNATDLAIMKGTFGASGVGYAGGNANCDTIVNATDLAILKDSFGFVAPTGGSAGLATGGGVPEPMTIGLLGVGACLQLFRRKRR